jgi:FKBP-type peptidyl-prolyl cis-trans isomerase
MLKQVRFCNLPGVLNPEFLLWMCKPMKKKAAVRLFAALILIPAFLGGCKKNASDDTIAFDKDASYALGMYLAAQFNIPDVTYDYKSFQEGFKAFTEAEETRFSMDEAITKIQAAFELISARESGRSDAQGEVSKAEGEAFLAENKTKPGVITTSSGLQYEVITEGSGAKPGAGDTVQVHYEGVLLDGTVFDSSYSRGEPAEFPLGNVIAGWTEGLQLMTEGSVYRFFIPSELAYGTRGSGSSIPPNSALIFMVELLSIVN